MRYMLLIYTREEGLPQRTREEMQQVMSGHFAVMNDARARGALEKAEPLAKTNTATTVRIQNGAPIITDGPFAESKEIVGGYFIVKANSIDEAAAIAKGCPDFELGSSVEVREVMVM